MVCETASAEEKEGEKEGEKEREKERENERDELVAAYIPCGGRVRPLF